jgi:hypothetical protein
MENKAFWIGGIVVALAAGIILGVVLQKRKAKKATKTSTTTKEPEKVATVQPQEPEKADASLIKTA